MTEPMVIITNNPALPNALAGKEHCEVRYYPVSYREVLCLARNMVHAGHRLLTHPLAGSVKPGETPYRSVALSFASGALDMPSLELIENSIVTCDKFPIRPKSAKESLQEDFQVVDLTLMQSIF